MRVRSVTCFLRVDGTAADSPRIAAAGRFAKEAAGILKSAGFAVESVRLATQPLLTARSDGLGFAGRLGPLCAESGFEFVSAGAVPVEEGGDWPAVIDRLPELIRGTENVFVGVLLRSLGHGAAFEALRRTARAVREISQTTPEGFGNLRMAMLAGVEPLCPFFPAAYHDGGPPAVALATDSADLAIAAFAGAASLADARQRLTDLVQAAADRLVGLVRPLAEGRDWRFAGIDFSLAPFPDASRSIGRAIEELGVERFGAPGTLFAASLVTECLRRATYPRCGFNGLMIPVLEDSTLALRALEGGFSVNDLLLYSAVCGTGLDTVPLPGDATEDELAGILLDVAALAFRLAKPLTARLMPIPGARAGDPTHFDFPYLADSRVLATKGCGCARLFERAKSLHA
jgi:uncharacterized protein (UPF0210 family)